MIAIGPKRTLQVGFAILEKLRLHRSIGPDLAHGAMRQVSAEYIAGSKGRRDSRCPIRIELHLGSPPLSLTVNGKCAVGVGRRRVSRHG